jgi:DNA mismatch endonuclease (patch repair protein)
MMMTWQDQEKLFVKDAEMLSEKSILGQIENTSQLVSTARHVEESVKLCECGCGHEVNYNKGKPNKYIFHHKKSSKTTVKKIIEKRYGNMGAYSFSHFWLLYEFRMCKCNCGTVIRRFRSHGRNNQYREIFYVNGHSERGKPKHITTKWRQKMIDGLRKNPPNKGKAFSDEWKARLSDGQRRRFEDPLERIKLSRIHMGKPSSRKGKHLTPEQVEKLLQSMANRQRSGTKPEIAVKKIIDDERLPFDYQVPIFGSILDFWSKELRIALEVNGCYFHSCPRCYNRETILNEPQYERQQRDKKLKVVLRKHNVELLELWEHDINSRPNFIRSEILRVVGERKDMLNEIEFEVK